jgi:alpha-galactosidase
MEVVSHVKDVLADPKKVYPDYNAEEGYEIAGFVWFQGFNDLVGPYPRTDPAQGKKSVKDYSEYSSLMACFIRDIRKDLDAPGMPFVIGVLGTGGEDAGENSNAFRKAMAAPVELDEFKGNVSAVYTHEFWPSELDEVRARRDEVLKPFAKRGKEAKALEGDARKKAFEQLQADQDAAMKAALSEEDLWLLENGISNQGFHYWGSAKFFAQIGEAFAKAMAALEK